MEAPDLLFSTGRATLFPLRSCIAMHSIANEYTLCPVPFQGPGLFDAFEPGLRQPFFYFGAPCFRGFLLRGLLS